MNSTSSKNKRQVEGKRFTEWWDNLFGIKKDPQNLADHVWNDKMKDYQIGIDLAMINGIKEKK